ncbi:MAG TPA: SCP2 sterol-binding domain-containing protein [Acidimicrobiales bacterium]|nr:SCP2 sterol-binding domain-containing protein [Acidimicrobiales bacterium]
MVPFLSSEWVAAFNAALEGAELTQPADGRSVRAESGRFRVEQHVTGVPGRPESDGPLRVILAVEAGRVTLSASSKEATDDRADVVVSLSYEDAAALSRGELDPTEALGTGRVHVRGDLSVLVAGQGILASAAGQMAELQANTSY